MSISKTKTFVALAIAGALAFAPLVGCAGNSTSSEEEAETTEQTEDTQAADEQLAGGWAINTEAPDVLTDDERALFEKAAADYADAKLEPITVLATQLVSGTNYAFLCKATHASETTAHWAIAVVYNDLEGNATITSENDIELGNIATAKDAKDTTGFTGAWAVRDPANAIVLSEDAENAFSIAYDKYKGVDLTPMVELGSQVVAGTNYLVLCQAITGEDNPAEQLYIAQLYANLEGDAEFTSVEPFDLLAYV